MTESAQTNHYVKRVSLSLLSATLMICSFGLIPVNAEDGIIAVNREEGKSEEADSFRLEQDSDPTAFYEEENYNVQPLLAGPDGECEIIRLAGADRYVTASYVSSAKYRLDGAMDNAIVADGKNYPDALSGGYLAKVTNAPLFLTDSSVDNQIAEILSSYLTEGGRVFILGGTGAVSASFEETLKADNINTVRYSGRGRYDTNLAILNACYKEGDELLVARGDNFPDSLSGSASQRPMLLVDKQLNEDQIEWLEQASVSKFYILGGTGAVSTEVEKALNEYAPVERVSGRNRWETSLAIARKFNSDADVITIATGLNFPDALSGSPLAMALNSPIVLASDNDWQCARQYVAENNIADMLIIGGRGAIAPLTVDRIMYGPHSYPTFRSLGINSSLDSRIDLELDQLAGLMLEGGDNKRLTNLSLYDQTFDVLNYVGANYSYGDGQYTAEGMLKYGYGTCFAFSELVYLMLKKLGVTCWLTVAGRHKDGTYGNTYRQYGSQHRSVVALIDGIYYDVDGNFAYLYMSMGSTTAPAEISEAYAKYLIGMTDSF